MVQSIYMTHVEEIIHTAFLMESNILIFVFHIFLFFQLRPSNAQDLIRAGYYDCSKQYINVSEINSSLFTHLINGFAGVNSTTNQLSLLSSEKCFSTFTDTVKQKNPSVITLLAIGSKNVNDSTFSSMVSNSFYRKSFVDSSIQVARLYGFQGLDFFWCYPNTKSDMSNMGILFEEWRAAIQLEAKNSSQSELIFTAGVYYSTSILPSGSTYSVDSIRQYLDWVHVVASQYSVPGYNNFTGVNAALYDPAGVENTDYGIREWINAGLSANKLVLFLPFYGYEWTLVNSKDNSIGAPAAGPANKTTKGLLTYKEIKDKIERRGPNVQVIYNETYVVNYFTIGTSWINFDDVQAIRAKVSYAKEKGLLGYVAWKVSYDDNWVLSEAAASEAHINNSSAREDNKKLQNKRIFSVILLPTAAAVILLLGIILIFFCWRRKLILNGTRDSSKEPNMDKVNKAAAARDFNRNVPNLIEYSLAAIEAATDGFSIKNKLGQGGYGPVYKGVLSNGQEIAVKKLAKASTQGFEEFKNEVTLTAKLQHVNLLRVLGFCIDEDEQILVYEYMRNKSLDSYLFDPVRLYVLDWEKRIQIIEGVTQGLLYLQEYSRLTIIHRDLKMSNILLDEDMKPKISDFGMARIFAKDDLEANTGRIVGTLGYVPPEYARKGMYSTKSDVYSFGVLLLQIISGKRISLLCGPNESLSLSDYAYELWNDGRGTKFMDESLDDTYSSCKLVRCLQIALLCVQENPIDRPSMLEVFTMLKNESIDMMIPRKPAFSEQNLQNKTTRQLEVYSGSTSSINDVTFSDVLAR